MRPLETNTIESEHPVMRLVEQENADAMFRNWVKDLEVTRFFHGNSISLLV